MKNTDNEIIVSANCSALSHTFKKITHRTQNGFTGGRNFLNNLVALDACSRMYSMMYAECHSSNPSNIPIAFDFEAALPSVIHDWIWMVLQHRRMPLHFIRLFKSIYKHARAIYTHKGKTHTLISFSLVCYKDALHQLFCSIMHWAPFS